MNEQRKPGTLPDELRQLAVERRRGILRAMGVASAGAALPMGALAGTVTGSGHNKYCWDAIDGKWKHPTMSGCASVVMSTGSKTEVHSYKCGYYGGHTGNWPASCSYNQYFYQAFSCGAGDKDSGGRTYGSAGCLLNKTMYDLCTNYSTSDEATWCTAYANSCKVSNFPYLPADVCTMYKGQSQYTASSCKDFFKRYTEVYTS